MIDETHFFFRLIQKLQQTERHAIVYPVKQFEHIAVINYETCEKPETARMLSVLFHVGSTFLLVSRYFS
jgi:hypothetical protein